MQRQKAVQSAKLAFRRMMRLRSTRSPAEHAAAFAQVLTLWLCSNFNFARRGIACCSGAQT